MVSKLLYGLVQMLFMIVIITAQCNIVFADGTPDNSSYYDSNPKRGYWWYEDPESVKHNKEKKKEELTLSQYTPQELWNMHPDKFKELLDAFLKQAVQSPTEQHVRDYYVLQDIARRKALAFANVAAYVWQKYPELNLEKDNPVAIPGRVSKARLELNEVRNTIMEAKDDFALIYFYSPDCEFCQVQSQILKYFTDKYHWQIKEVDINRRPDLAVRFNVETVPVLLLVYRHSQDYLPVSVGVVAMNQIEERLYRGIRLFRGETTPENWSLHNFQKNGGFDVRNINLPDAKYSE